MHYSPHLEKIPLTPMAGHRLSLVGSFQEGGCWYRRRKYGLSTAPHSIGDPLRAPHVCCCRRHQLNWWVVDCCTAGTNVCLDLRRRAFPLGGQVRAEWSRYPGSMPGRARDGAAPLRRSSAGWMSARIGRLSAGVRCRHPVTVLVVDGRINEAGVSTAATGRSAVCNSAYSQHCCPSIPAM